MRARFWWALRNWWHYPQFWHMAQRPDYFRWYYYWWMVKQHKWYSFFFCLMRDLKMFIRQMYWELRYLQPLRCNGSRGGWRTKICDWLEDKARSYEK